MREKGLAEKEGGSMKDGIFFRRAGEEMHMAEEDMVSSSPRRARRGRREHRGPKV